MSYLNSTETVSPTLSNHSGHFSSTQLRHNKPEEKYNRGMKGHKIDDIEETELAQDATVNPAPFRFKPYELAHMVDPKNIDILLGFGGVDGLLRGLGTNADTGIFTKSQHTNSSKSFNPNGQGESSRHDVEDEISSVPSENDDPAFSASLQDRRRIYGENVLPTRITLLPFVWTALMDKLLTLLSIIDAVSLALKFFQRFGPSPNKNTPPVHWAEGLEIMVLIPIVVIIGSFNDWKRELQIKALNDRKEKYIKVIRDGVETMIYTKEVVVGDIAFLEPGEVIPCDGIFISGHNVKCDESAVTGQPFDVKKASFAEVLDVYRHTDHEYALHKDCFILAGSKVVEGTGKYVIVAVGNKSFNDRIMMALCGDAGEYMSIHVKLNYLSGLIAKIGSSVGFVLFLASMINVFTQLCTTSRISNQYGALVITVTSIVVAMHEGLPLAVTLALAFVTKCMNQLVRVVWVCETTANASVICTDTLTQNIILLEYIYVMRSGALYIWKIWRLFGCRTRLCHVHTVTWERRKLHYISPINRTTIKRELYQVNYSQTTVDTDARAHVGSEDPIISIPSLNDVDSSSSNKIPHQYCTGVAEVSAAKVNDTVSPTSIKRTRSPFDSNTSGGNHKNECQSYTHHYQASTTLERTPSTSKQPTTTIQPESESESTNLLPAYHQFFMDGIEYQELVSILAPVVASIVRHPLMWEYTKDLSKRTAGMTADLQARDLLDFIAARSHIPKFRNGLLAALKAQSDLNGFVRKRI